jgi:hypothetical protein
VTFLHFGRSVTIIPDTSVVELQTATESMKCNLYKCPTTGWHYFYATLPVEIINSDDTDASGVGLQPRYLIFIGIFKTTRFFNHPSVVFLMQRFFSLMVNTK